MDSNNIGATIASLRKKKGLTQQQLADELYMTQPAICKWEKGIASPDYPTACKMAEFFEVSIDDLTSGKALEASNSTDSTNTIPQAPEMPSDDTIDKEEALLTQASAENTETTEKNDNIEAIENTETQEDNSPAKPLLLKKLKYKWLIGIVVMCLLIISAIALHMYKKPSFEVVSQYYDSSGSLYDYDLAYDIIVSHKEGVTEDDMLEYADSLMDEYRFLINVDAIIILFYENWHEDSTDSYTYVVTYPIYHRE